MNVTASARPRHSLSCRVAPVSSTSATSGTSSPGSSASTRGRAAAARSAARGRCASMAVRYAAGVRRRPASPEPGRRPRGPRGAPASLTLNGIVMPGMNPLMSSCLIVISCRAGSTARICPRSSYSRPRLHAAASEPGRAVAPSTSDTEGRFRYLRHAFHCSWLLQQG